MTAPSTPQPSQEESPTEPASPPAQAPQAPPVAPPAPRVSLLDSVSRPLLNWRRGARYGLITTLVGFLIFLIGARPSLFSLDRSQAVGFIQIAVFLVGLAIICVGGYTSLRSIWKDRELSIPAEIGQRLIATGYVIAVFAGMADVFGMGSHPLPFPYFGPWQARGVEIGELLIGVGFILLLPFARRVPHAKA